MTNLSNCLIFAIGIPILLLISSGVPELHADEQSVGSCESECYTIIKPLLKYFETFHTNDAECNKLKAQIDKHDKQLTNQNDILKRLNGKVLATNELLKIQLERLENKNKASKIILPDSCAGLVGVETIQVPGADPFEVFCDDYVKNGWIVIHRIKDWDTSFNRPWWEFKVGFGTLDGDFFIGLEKLHLLTKSNHYELYIHSEDPFTTKYARYTRFAVGNETEGYKIKAIGSYSGSYKDSFSPLLGIKFSTYDRDQDADPNDNIARSFGGGWWYKTEHYSLNVYAWRWGRIQAMIRKKHI